MKQGVHFPVYGTRIIPVKMRTKHRQKSIQYFSSIPRGMIVCDQFVCPNFRLWYGSLKSQSIHIVVVFIGYHRLVNLCWLNMHPRPCVHVMKQCNIENYITGFKCCMMFVIKKIISLL